jgi:xanthine dehydrogenase small subunit
MNFYAPSKMAEAVQLKKQHPELKLISSATDLGVLINKEKFFPTGLLNLNHVAELHVVIDENDHVVVGARVSLTQLEQFLETKSKSGLQEIARMIRIFASPQIKNTATLVGNIANASPIADTIPAMLAMNAELELVSAQGTRKVPLRNFYLGYKKLDLKPEEIIARVHIPYLKKEEKLKLYKVSNRRDMDISTVTFAAKIKATDSIQDLALFYGGVGPVVQQVQQTQNSIVGKPFNLKTFTDAGKVLETEIKPISDVRCSKDYRMIVAKNLLEKFYYDLGAEA